MNRAATAGFIAIVAAALLIAWRSTEPQQLATGGQYDKTMAAGMVVVVDALTPTATTLPTSTRTPRPEIATETPLPTYASQASPAPGLYRISVPTPTYDVIDWPSCAELIATPILSERTCEVK